MIVSLCEISYLQSCSPSFAFELGLPVTVDGAMLASRDFGFMLTQGTLTMLLQLFLLQSAWCTTITAVFGTFTIRLGSYAVTSLLRAGLGRGKLGRALRSYQWNRDQRL